jgi:VWFA-related protein
MYGKVFLSLLLLSSLLLPIRGQKPQPSPAPPSTPTAPQVEAQDVVRITTNLVQVDAVVTKDDKLVTDLKPEDFEVTEDGHLQTITNFSYVSNVTETKSVASASAKAPGRDKAPAPIIPPALHPNEARRTIALVVDDLGMSQSSIIQLRSRLRKFVNEELLSNDLVAIIRTGGEVGALQQFTNDKRLLQGAVDRLRWNPCSRTGLHVFTPVGRDSGQNLCSLSSEGGTLQSLLFILQGMKDLPGRKSMILLTDDLQLPLLAGMSNSQQPDLSTSGVIGASSNMVAQRVLSGMPAFEKIVEFAIRASVVVYSVDTRGLQYTGVTAADRLGPVVTRPAGTIRQELLSTGPTNVFLSTASSRSAALLAGREGGDFISRGTGGFGVHNANDLGLKQIAEDQQGYYLLAYRPVGEIFNRKFHHIKITVKRKGLAVRTRAGFYGLTDEEEHSRKPTAADRLAIALISPFGSNEIALRLTTLFANSPSSGSFLKAFLYVNATDLTFVDAPDGTHRATFDLGIIAFGDNGIAVNQENRVATLSLHDAIFQQALREGVVYPFEVPIKQPGALQFRVALRDQASQRIGTAGQFIEVPNLKNQRLALSGLVLWSSQTSDEGAISGSPGVRQFRQGSEIGMAYSIYEALVDQTSHLPQLSAQTRIFREGKLVYTGPPTPIDLSGQTDLQRIVNAGRLRLGADFPPGEYVLQVSVTNGLAKEKQRITSQAIDFEVLK